MLEDWRRQIDVLDVKILTLLKKRYQITAKIGIHKKKAGQKTIDRKREAEILDKVDILAQKNLLPRAQTKKIFREIIKLSYHSQK